MEVDPKLFPRGTAVVLSELGRAREIAPSESRGIVTSPHPKGPIVTVEWAHKKSRDRIHVDFLRPQA